MNTFLQQSLFNIIMKAPSTSAEATKPPTPYSTALRWAPVSMLHWHQQWIPPGSWPNVCFMGFSLVWQRTVKHECRTFVPTCSRLMYLIERKRTLSDFFGIPVKTTSRQSSILSVSQPLKRTRKRRCSHKRVDQPRARTLRSNLFAHFCTCQSIKKVMKLHCKNLPTCLNLTLCQMLNTNPTLLFNILIAVVVTIDLAVMFTNSIQPTRVYLKRDHPEPAFPPSASLRSCLIDADVAYSFLSQCGPELCKAFPLLLKATPLWSGTIVTVSPNCMRMDDLLNCHQSLAPGFVVHPKQFPWPHYQFSVPSTLRELIVIQRTPQLPALQTQRTINGPIFTVQMVTTQHHTSLTVHMLKDQACNPAERDHPYLSFSASNRNIWSHSTYGRERLIKCAQLVNEWNASTLSQLHANEMMHHLHLNEYGSNSNLQNLEPDSQIRSDPITSLEVWWRRRRLMTTSSISFSIDHKASWETSPWQGRWTEPKTAPNRTTKVYFCDKTFTNVTYKIPRYGNSSVQINVSV